MIRRAFLQATGTVAAVSVVGLPTQALAVESDLNLMLHDRCSSLRLFYTKESTPSRDWTVELIQGSETYQPLVPLLEKIKGTLGSEWAETMGWMAVDACWDPSRMTRIFGFSGELDPTSNRVRIRIPTPRQRQNWWWAKFGNNEDQTWSGGSTFARWLLVDPQELQTSLKELGFLRSASFNEWMKTMGVVHVGEPGFDFDYWLPISSEQWHLLMQMPDRGFGVGEPSQKQTRGTPLESWSFKGHNWTFMGLRYYP